jgi:hypothetical protein
MTSNKTLRAVKIVSVMKTGSSSPVVAEGSNGEKYLVKLKGAMSGPMATICDWVSCKLAERLGLPVVKTVCIEIKQDIDLQSLDEEMRMLLQKSNGLNLAYSFYEGARDYEPTDIDYTDPQFTDLFLFDLFLLNADRNWYNLNLIEVDARIFTLDYESSFLLMGIMEGKDYFTSHAVIRQLRQNPLYNHLISPEKIKEFFKRLKETDISPPELPIEWIKPFHSSSAKLRKILHAGIDEAAQSEEKYMELYRKLESMELESEEERKKRIVVNREIFEKKIKKH